MNLKNSVILAVLVIGVWLYFGTGPDGLNLGHNPDAKPLVDNSAILKAQDAANLLSNQYRCDGRQYCSQMTTAAEALFFLNYCTDTKLEMDMDGVPCGNDSRW